MKNKKLTNSPKVKLNNKSVVTTSVNKTVVCDPCKLINKNSKIKFGTDALTSDKLKLNSTGNKEFSKIGFKLLCKREHVFSGIHWFEDGEYMKILWKADLKNNAIIITEVTEFGKGGEMKQTNLNKHDIQLIQTMIDTTVEPIKEDVNILKEDVNILKEDVKTLKEDVKRLDKKMDDGFAKLGNQISDLTASLKTTINLVAKIAQSPTP